MQDDDHGIAVAAEEALKLLREIEQNYSQQVKRIMDPEIEAVLEAIKMFHENSEKKLKDFLNALADKRQAIDE